MLMQIKIITNIVYTFRFILIFSMNIFKKLIYKNVCIKLLVNRYIIISLNREYFYTFRLVHKRFVITSDVKLKIVIIIRI